MIRRAGQVVQGHADDSQRALLKRFQLLGFGCVDAQWAIQVHAGTVLHEAERAVEEILKAGEILQFMNRMDFMHLARGNP